MVCWLGGVLEDILHGLCLQPASGPCSSRSVGKMGDAGTFITSMALLANGP